MASLRPLCVLMLDVLSATVCKVNGVQSTAWRTLDSMSMIESQSNANDGGIHVKKIKKDMAFDLVLGVLLPFTKQMSNNEIGKG